ncbi:MAG TPA: hypothetical protein VNU26_06870 [Mycobacteriales bacterium]|nr:hypothetical protein [Mycobacteriales bacterium]
MLVHRTGGASLSRRRALAGALGAASLTLVVTAPPSLGAASVPPQSKVHGLGITTSWDGHKVVPLDAARMASTGSNSVSLEATWIVTSPEDNSIEPGGRTVPDEALRAAAMAAHENGLDVLVNVKVACEGCSNHWRGKLRPSDKAAFFDSYRVMTNHYASLSEGLGSTARGRVVDSFFVGSEMNTLQRETSQWIEILNQARARFTGPLGYQVNWDAMHEVRFWPFTDIAGISVYMPLSDALQPNVADLVAAWRSSQAEAWKGTNWLAEIEKLANTSGKPVLFGEIGYQSAAQATQRPWQQEKLEGDHQVQADAYQAALQTFYGKSWFLGFMWWEWKITSATPEDTDYSPRNKLAEQLLVRWYRGERPTGESSMVGVTRPSSRGKPVPQDSLKGPSSPDGRTTLSAPVPQVERTTPPRTTTAPPPPKTAAPKTSTAVAAPLPTTLPPTTAAPQVTAVGPRSGLEAVPVTSLEEALALAEERRAVRRGAVVAGLLAAALGLGHAVFWARRYGPTVLASPLVRRFARTSA